MAHKNSKLKEGIKHGDYIIPLGIYYNIMDEFNEGMTIHWHTEMEITYIKSGKGIYNIDLKSFEVSEGDIIIIPPSSLHSAKSQVGFLCKCETLVFDMNFFRSYDIDSIYIKYIVPIKNNVLNLPIVIKKEEHINSYIYNNINEIINNYKYKKRCYELYIKSLFLHILIILIENSTYNCINNKDVDCKCIIKIKQIINYVQENYKYKISIKEISEIVGYSEFYFCKFFKFNMGQTFIEYLNLYRINKACELLLYSKLNITQICYKVGFEDVSYFIRIFKKNKGFSPSKYRKENQYQILLK